MDRHFFIGIDGGGTKCILRVEDEAGQLLGEALAGPANIRLSVEQAWQAINSALTEVLTPHSLTYKVKTNYFHTVMGLAGTEFPPAYQAFIEKPHGFATLQVTSDAHIACIGAHRGEAGAIIIAGTGVIGFQDNHGKVDRVSGWGFPHDDMGGGAWLGLEATKIALQTMDGRLPASTFADTIFQHFQSQQAFVTWVNQANATAFASLAPLVVREAEAGNAMAIELLKKAAVAIDHVAVALARTQPDLPCALLGGVAPFIEPYLNSALRSRLRPSLASPVIGALLLARKNWKEKA